MKLTLSEMRHLEELVHIKIGALLTSEAKALRTVGMDLALLNDYRTMLNKIRNEIIRLETENQK